MTFYDWLTNLLLNSHHGFLYRLGADRIENTFRLIVEKDCLPRRFLATEVYYCGTDHIENTSVIVNMFILGDCPATNRNIRYNNGLPIVGLQY
jgi:hypothetical protein